VSSEKLTDGQMIDQDLALCEYCENMYMTKEYMKQLKEPICCYCISEFLILEKDELKSFKLQKNIQRE